MDLKFGYDFKISWPGAWYFRNFPSATYMGERPNQREMEDHMVVIVGDENKCRCKGMLEDRYYEFSLSAMWWPMQDYFKLTADRVINTFDLSPDDPLARSSVRVSGIFGGGAIIRLMAMRCVNRRASRDAMKPIFRTICGMLV